MKKSFIRLSLPAAVHAGIRCAMFLVVWSAVAYTAQAQRPVEDEGIVVLKRADNAQALGMIRAVVRDSITYRRLWAAAWQSYRTTPKAPPIDFSRYDVVVVGIGEQFATGDVINVVGMDDDALSRVIHVSLAVRGTGCNQGAKTTNPAVFVRLLHSRKIPVFQEAVTQQSCPTANARTTTPPVPPDTTPQHLFDSLGVVSGAPLSRGPYQRDIVLVEFLFGTPQSARQAAIDSVAGQVVGGSLDDDKTDGAYYVRVKGGTTAALLDAVEILQRQPQVAIAIWLDFSTPDEQALRRSVPRRRNVHPCSTCSSRPY
jgi:hypothetical protein